MLWHLQNVHLIFRDLMVYVLVIVVMIQKTYRIYIHVVVVKVLVKK